MRKIEIAELQLNRAINLLIQNNDVVCAITLAGAAEGILAGLLKSQGETDVLSDISKSAVDMGENIGKKWDVGIFKSEFNFFKNELKHHDKGHEFIPIFKEAAFEIVDRSIENFRRITGSYSPQMLEFMSIHS